MLDEPSAYLELRLQRMCQQKRGCYHWHPALEPEGQESWCVYPFPTCLSPLRSAMPTEYFCSQDTCFPGEKKSHGNEELSAHRALELSFARRSRIRVESFEAHDMQEGASFPVLPLSNLECGFIC